MHLTKVKLCYQNYKVIDFEVNSKFTALVPSKLNAVELTLYVEY